MREREGGRERDLHNWLHSGDEFKNPGKEKENSIHLSSFVFRIMRSFAVLSPVGDNPSIYLASYLVVCLSRRL